MMTMKRYLLFLFQYLFTEKTRGLDFTMRKNTMQKEENPKYYGYSKTNEKHLRSIFDSLSYQECRNFLDIGCGKGVVLKEAANYPFQRIAGIELLPDLVKAAQNNFKILKLQDRVTCMEANAQNYDGYAEFDTFFLFNPFAKEILTKVAEKLEEISRKERRTITVIYHNPRYLYVFEKMPGYEKKEELYDSLKDYKTCIFQIRPLGSDKLPLQ